MRLLTSGLSEGEKGSTPYGERHAGGHRGASLEERDGESSVWIMLDLKCLPNTEEGKPARSAGLDVTRCGRG